MVEFERALPANNDDLMAMTQTNREFLATAKIRIMQRLSNAIEHIQWESPFDEVDANERALMEARSRQMLKNINASAAGLERTIYKIGNEHVEDIQRLRLAPAAGVTVLSRAQYLVEYRSLANRSAGNLRIADQVANEDL